MKLLNEKEKIERIDQLIRLNATGNAHTLADKLNITERTVFRILNQLKELGCPIYFNKAKNSYCYEYEGHIVIKFEETKSFDLNAIKGGKIKIIENNLHAAIFWQWTNLYLSYLKPIKKE